MNPKKKYANWKKAFWVWIIANACGAFTWYYLIADAPKRLNLDDLAGLIFFLVFLFTAPLIVLLSWIFEESGKRTKSWTTHMLSVVICMCVLNLVFVVLIAWKLDLETTEMAYFTWPYTAGSLLAAAWVNRRFVPASGA